MSWWQVRRPAGCWHLVGHIETESGLHRAVWGSSGSSTRNASLLTLIFMIYFCPLLINYLLVEFDFQLLCGSFQVCLSWHVVSLSKPQSSQFSQEVGWFRCSDWSLVWNVKLTSVNDTMGQTSTQWLLGKYNLMNKVWLTGPIRMNWHLKINKCWLIK